MGDDTSVGLSNVSGVAPMVVVGSAFLFLGMLGFFASTFGSAGLAWILTRFSRVSLPADKTTSLRSLDIVIAAHNEEGLILQTLDSIAGERMNFLRGHAARVRIWVGADHCTDGTEGLARRWFETNRVEGGVIENPNAPGKWHILEHLVSKSDAEWIALVDVGASWAPGLLAEALPHLSNRRVSGVAPSYRPAAAGVLDRLTWRLERTLKTVEALAGGPVSVHGATVFYRRTDLIKAYKGLKRAAPSRHWLNDDVVLPLMLRISSPAQRISYLARKTGEAWVMDYGVSSKARGESGRRKRILIGNLQWMKTLYGKAIASSLPLGLIASRRVFRAFWAYWTLFGLIGVALLGVGLFHLSFPASALVLAALAGISRMEMSGGLERLRAAFWAGLELPMYWFTTERVSSEKLWN